MEKIKSGKSDAEILGNISGGTANHQGNTTNRISRTPFHEETLKHEPTYVTNNKRRQDYGQVDYSTKK